MKLAFKSGAVIPLLLMLPNVAWALFYNSNAGSGVSVPSWLSTAENVGRVAVLAMPFFYSLDANKKYAPLAMVGMSAALALYYAAWARFFAGGGSVELLSAPIWGIPGPLAIAPVMLLMCASYLMSSWWMFSVALVFGALHVASSALSLRIAT